MFYASARKGGDLKGCQRKPSVEFPCDIFALPVKKIRDADGDRQWLAPEDSRDNSRIMTMRYLHTMVRVSDLDASLDFYCNKLGLVEVRRMENEKGRFTLVFLATPDDAKRIAAQADTALAAESPVIELTYNWDEKGYAGGRNFGHLAYRVNDIYALCEKLMAAGVTINRPPRDGHMAFIRSPDGISIELLQDGHLEPREPWASMPNTGGW